MDFLTSRPQHVKVGTSTSSTIVLNTGVPQGCVLSPVLCTLYTHGCVASHRSNSLIKFDPSISNNNETFYGEEIQMLVGSCSNNHLNLNTKKPKKSSGG